MGVEWSFYRADPATFARIDDDAFDPHPFDPEEIDLMLVGDTNGPLMEAMLESVKISSPAVMGIPCDVVAKLATRVKPIERSDFSSFDVVLKGSFHTVDNSDERDFYAELAATTESLQQFVAKAAEAAASIRVELR
jgi:hypothetical protein